MSIETTLRDLRKQLDAYRAAIEALEAIAQPFDSTHAANGRARKDIAGTPHHAASIAMKKKWAEKRAAGLPWSAKHVTHRVHDEPTEDSKPS